MRLSLQTRINMAQRAEEYIVGLVDNHNGDRGDVLSIIDNLQHQAALGNHDHALGRSRHSAPDVAPSPFVWQEQVASP